MKKHVELVGPPTEFGEVVLRALEDRWREFLRLLDAVIKKPTSKRVHDLRIALRRMCSGLEVVEQIIGGKTVRRLSKRLAAALRRLGKLRDVHVQRKEIGEMAERFPGLLEFHERLRKKEEKLEPRAQRALQEIPLNRLRELFDEAAAEALLALSSEALQRRHRDTAIEAIDRRFAHVIDCRRALDVADLETIHNMRVAFKKFRYMLEVVQPMLVGLGKAQLASMQAFQSMMGDVHDLQVLNEMVAAYRASHNKAAHDLVAAHDDVGRRLLHKTDALVASADEIFSFWNQSYLPGN